MEECVHACETVSQLPAIKALLNSTVTFDMVIVEVFGSECFLPFGQRFKAPVVGFLSSVPLPWVNEQLGNPDATAYVPSYMMGYGQQMSLWERFANTMAVVWAKILYRYKSQMPSQVSSYMDLHFCWTLCIYCSFSGVSILIIFSRLQQIAYLVLDRSWNRQRRTTVWCYRTVTSVSTRCGRQCLLQSKQEVYTQMRRKNYQGLVYNLIIFIFHQRRSHPK